MNSGRLLQCLNHVQQQTGLHFMRIRQPSRTGDEKIAYHAFAAFVDEKGVAHDSSPLDRGVAWQYLGIDVTQNHLRRTGVVPGEHTRPFPHLVLQQGTQIGRGEVSKVENLHVEAPEFRLAKRAHMRAANSECSALLRREANGGIWSGNRGPNRSTNWHLALGTWSAKNDALNCSASLKELVPRALCQMLLAKC